MKIGCLTFHDSSNYGSVLQAYALQHAVIGLGHAYKIIDYSNPEKRKFDSLLFKNIEQSWKNYLYKIVSLPFNYSKKKKFIRFSKKYLCLEKPRVVDSKLLCDLNNKFDCFICGSDQIWNAKMIRFDTAYFLSFVEMQNRKVAYAASFGRVELSKKEEMFYKKQLETFDKISVRERSAQDIVQQCAQKKAELVVDPTLLLNSYQWLDFIDDVDILQKPYILTYCLSADQEMLRFLDKLKKDTGLPVIEIARSIFPVYKHSERIIPDPREFVKLIANASYIVTNSFHGTAFSTNLNRNFFVFIHGGRESTTNSRIVDFLEMVGLEKRLFFKCPDGEVDLNLPDFSSANERIARMRASSIEFLKSAMQV